MEKIEYPLGKALTAEEQLVMKAANKLVRAFTKLPVLHPADRQEFVTAIHQIQNIVLARASYNRKPRTVKVIKPVVRKVKRSRPIRSRK